jgi:hypothetical protein
VAIAPAQNLVLQHTVGGNVDDYVIDFQQKDVTEDVAPPIGIHNQYIGGYINSANHFFGAYWHDLKSTEISVERRLHDTRTEQVRIRIWVVR